MPRVPALPPDQLDDEQRQLYSSIVGGPRGRGPQAFSLIAADGSLRGPFNALLLSPAIGDAVQALGAAIRYATGFSSRERELAILCVAHTWGSAFELEAHTAVGRAAGVGDDELADLAAGRTPAGLTTRERVCVEAARELAHGDLTDATWSEAESLLGTRLIFELSTLVGYYALLALQLRAFRVDEEPARRP